jgi:hypothetical protein
MRSNSTTFDQLCSCFRGVAPARADWISIVELANRTLTTTALKPLTANNRNVPADVGAYVNHLFERNLARNARLEAQLTEFVTALNADGIIPILLKGAALLATRDKASAALRLISDLDILVAPSEFERALECSGRLGYRIHYRSPSQDSKCYADLERSDNVGMIDLHRERPGHKFFYRSHADVTQYCKLRSGEVGTFYVPTSSYQALILVFHDAFQDYDYWLGTIDLRHLLDLRDLVQLQNGADWNELALLAPSRLAQNALAAHFITLSSLLGVSVDLPFQKRLAPKIQSWRRVLRARRPRLKYPLLVLNLLDYWTYRAEIARTENAEWRPSLAMSPMPKVSTLNFLLSLSRERRPGKV